MKVIQRLLAESRLLFAAGVIASVISGIATMGVLIVLFHIIGGERSSDVAWWQFAGLALTAATARAVSRRMIERLGREALLRIRITLSRQIADAPLPALPQNTKTRFFSTRQSGGDTT